MKSKKVNKLILASVLGVMLGSVSAFAGMAQPNLNETSRVKEMVYSPSEKMSMEMFKSLSCTSMGGSCSKNSDCCSNECDRSNGHLVCW